MLGRNAPAEGMHATQGFRVRDEASSIRRGELFRPFFHHLVDQRLQLVTMPFFDGSRREKRKMERAHPWIPNIPGNVLRRAFGLSCFQERQILFQKLENPRGL